MLEAAREWLDGLRDFAADPRRRPRPAADAAPAEVAAERTIIAASLVAWIDTELPGLLAPHVAGREPAIVLTTSFAGLAAAADVLGRDDPVTRSLRPLFAVVSELEYRLWCIRHPDPDHALHLNHWNWIKTRVPAERWPALARRPLAEGERWWIHRQGTAAAGIDRRRSGLWRWNGGTAALVAPAFAERVGGL
jgi:hypothetical protein